MGVVVGVALLQWAAGWQSWRLRGEGGGGGEAGREGGGAVVAREGAEGVVEMEGWEGERKEEEGGAPCVVEAWQTPTWAGGRGVESAF